MKLLWLRSLLRLSSVTYLLGYIRQCALLFHELKWIKFFLFGLLFQRKIMDPRVKLTVFLTVDIWCAIIIIAGCLKEVIACAVIFTIGRKIHLLSIDLQWEEHKVLGLNLLLVLKSTFQFSCRFFALCQHRLSLVQLILSFAQFLILGVDFFFAAF